MPDKLPPDLLGWSIKRVFDSETQLASATDLRTDLVYFATEFKKKLDEYLEAHPHCLDKLRFEQISAATGTYIEALKHMKLHQDKA